VKVHAVRAACAAGDVTTVRNITRDWLYCN